MLCKNCGKKSEEKFCPNCGQPLETHRITFPHLLHEALHLFTHLDTGFLFTLKMLAVKPGTMQRHFIEGHRIKHQKPFSMFFICASILAIAIYWFTKGQQPTEQIAEAHNKFLKSYYVLTHIVLLPFYAFVTWVLFKWAHYNYAEILVQTMYTSSFMFILLIPINSLNILAPHLSSIALEVTVLAVYNTWTFVNFFYNKPFWIVILLAVINLVTNYFVFKTITDWLVEEVIAK
jgi:hypothetical protein